MRAYDTTVRDRLYQNQQFQIPIYQRRYSWAKKQCEQLFEDIITIGKHENETHFMGTIVYESCSTPLLRLTIIDGQQRITTLSLLLGALAKFLIQNREYEEPLGIEGTRIVNQFLLNTSETGEDKYKLRLTDDDNSTYKKIIDTLLSGTEFKFHENDIKSKLYKTFDYFSDNITEDNYEHIWKGINNLTLVTIELETETPQAIFERLNSTGQGLNATDLIRNYLLMDLKQKEKKEIYNTYWHEIESVFDDNQKDFELFIKYYLNVKYKNAISKDTYREFKNFKEQQYANKKVKTLVKDIHKYWGYYIKIAYGEEENKNLKKAFESLNQLPYTIVRPFIMELYDDYVHGNLKEDEFIEIINYTESYLFRRAICGRDSQSLKGFFAKMHNKLEHIKLDEGNYLEPYKYQLYISSGNSSMPTNEEFNREFPIVDIYHKKNVNKYSLLKLTNYDSTELTKIEECNIEHVMPQNTNLSKAWQEELGPNWEEIHKTYLHTIGNLTLTGSNSKLGDKTFQEKKTMQNGYNDSTINLNKYFRDIEHWTEEIYRPKVNKNDNYKYWSDCKHIIEKNYDFNPRTPNSSNRYILKINTSKAHIQLSINFGDNEVKSQLYIPKDKKLFEYLYAQRDEIESELSMELNWECSKNKQLSTISVVKTFDLENDWNWNESINWQLTMAEKLQKTFYPKIKQFGKIEE